MLIYFRGQGEAVRAAEHAHDAAPPERRGARAGERHEQRGEGAAAAGLRGRAGGHGY